MRRKLFLALLPAFALLGCDDTEPMEPAEPVEPEDPVAVTSVEVRSTLGSLVRRFLVGLDGAAALEIDYWTAASPRLRVESTSSRNEHNLLVPRLFPNTEYNYEVKAVLSSGTRGDAFGGDVHLGHSSHRPHGYRVRGAG